IASCSTSCVLPLGSGNYRLVASTAEQFSGYSGACTSSTNVCTISAASTGTVTLTFDHLPHAIWNKLFLTGETIITAQYDSGGNLLVGTEAHLAKLDPD